VDKINKNFSTINVDKYISTPPFGDDCVENVYTHFTKTTVLSEK